MCACPVTSCERRSHLLQCTGRFRPRGHTGYASAVAGVYPERTILYFSRRVKPAPSTAVKPLRHRFGRRRGRSLPETALLLQECLGRLRLRRYNRLVATDHRLTGTILPVGEESKKQVAQERDGSCATFVFEPPNGPTIQLSSRPWLL